MELPNLPDRPFVKFLAPAGQAPPAPESRANNQNWPSKFPFFNGPPPTMALVIRRTPTELPRAWQQK